MLENDNLAAWAGSSKDSRAIRDITEDGFIMLQIWSISSIFLCAVLTMLIVVTIRSVYHECKMGE